jgi:hypothetical protein
MDDFVDELLDTMYSSFGEFAIILFLCGIVGFVFTFITVFSFLVNTVHGAGFALILFVIMILILSMIITIYNIINVLWKRNFKK